MVKYYRIPKIRITVTHNETDYQLEGYSVLTDVILVENGVSQAIIKALDSDGETFLNKIDLNDNVKVELQYSDAPSASWTQVFGGWAFDLSPSLTEEQGEIVAVQCRGYGLGLLAMNVGEEYGTESSNPTLNTIKEVLRDGDKGILQNWVALVLNSAINSGYSFNATKIADVASDFAYLYFPYKPALKCMDDMIDLISAANVPNAGAHWIVIPDGTTAYLCLATIGAHEDPPADVWPTWWNTDQTGSTIEVKKDMIVSNFTKQRSDANYILYHGHFKRPVDGDKWTENNSAEWGVAGVVTVTDENVKFKKGSYSIEGNSIDAVGGWFFCPTGQNAAWDMIKWGGRFNHPTINYYAQVECAEGAASASGPYFFTNAGNYFSCAYNAEQSGGTPSVTDIWTHYQLEIGPNATTLYNEVNSPDWSDINYVGWRVLKEGASRTYLYIDNLFFDGWVLRGARDDTKIGTQKARIKVIVDDIAKDDSCVAAVDSGVMGQLAKAELYRAIQTPIIGVIVISGKEQILPGQLAHIHFGKKSDGDFNIDSDMRILQVHQRFYPEPHGFKTYLTLTDDVKNSRPIQPSVGYNLLLKAINPDFQTRDQASVKARTIDVSQTVLSKNYDT